MTEAPKNKVYDLEERTFIFSREVAKFCQELPRTMSNYEYGRQAIRAAGSVGANYIEANEALSRKDFLMRVKICRKEAKEAAYWIRLIIQINNKENIETKGKELHQEAIELKKIFSAIIEKSK